MRLVHKDTQRPAAIGDTIFSADGEVATLEHFCKPHKAASSGKILISNMDGECERYCNHYGLEWIEREDQGWVHPEVALKRVLKIYEDLTNVDMSGWNLEDVIGEIQVVEIGANTSLKGRQDAMFLMEWLDEQ